MKIKSENWVNIFTNLLILLWIYTAGSKILDFTMFRHELKLQNFSPSFVVAISYALPVSEIIISVLLIIPKLKRIGLFVSLILLTVFTIYIILILLGFFKNVPCSCGGVLSLIGWNEHLFFNLFFLSANIMILFILKRKEVPRN